MIFKNTLKSKTFLIGLAQIIGGICLMITGDADTGAVMLGNGFVAITMRDAISKVQ